MASDSHRRFNSVSEDEIGKRLDATDIFLKSVETDKVQLRQ